MGIADNQPYPTQSPGYQPPQELGPESAVFAKTDVYPQYLSFTRLSYAVGDHNSLTHHHATFAHLDVSGIQPEIRVFAFKRASTPLVHLFVQIPTDTRYFTLADAFHSQRLYQRFHLPRTHAQYVGFLDHRE